MSKIKRFWKPVLKTLLWAGLLFISVANLWVALSAKGRLIIDPAEVPFGSVGIVLGISEFHPDSGKPTDVYHPRLDAGAALAATGRLSALVVSGTPEQAETLRAELLRRGVVIPIIRDPHGLRTLDSVARAIAHQPERQLVFISQEWHVNRALWQAERMGRPSLGFAAAEGVGPRARYLGPARDILAKAKALLDWLTGFRLSTDIPPGEGNR